MLTCGSTWACPSNLNSTGSTNVSSWGVEGSARAVADDDDDDETRREGGSRKGASCSAVIKLMSELVFLLELLLKLKLCKSRII